MRERRTEAEAPWVLMVVCKCRYGFIGWPVKRTRSCVWLDWDVAGRGLHTHLRRRGDLRASDRRFVAVALLALARRRAQPRHMALDGRARAFVGVAGRGWILGVRRRYIEDYD